MNFAHVHLLLNHVPTVGTAIAIALLVIALVRKSDDLKRVALEVFFVVALMTMPAYLTGVSAGKLIAERPGVSVVMIGEHESAALYAFIWARWKPFLAWKMDNTATARAKIRIPNRR